MSELIVPKHIVNERIKKDFYPFVRYVMLITPNVFRKEMAQRVDQWLFSLPQGALEELKQTFFMVRQGEKIVPVYQPKSGAGKSRRLTGPGITIARSFVNDFIDFKRGKTWKDGQESNSHSEAAQGTLNSSTQLLPQLGRTQPRLSLVTP